MASVDLYYLLTPTSPGVDGHVVMGNVLRAIAENSTFYAIDHSERDNPQTIGQKVQLSIYPMDLEEMSKLWTMGNKQYKLSVALLVSMVYIFNKLPTKRIAPPVQKTGLHLETFTRPIIERIHPDAGPVGSTVRLLGANFSMNPSDTTFFMNE